MTGVAGSNGDKCGVAENLSCSFPLSQCLVPWAWIKYLNRYASSHTHTHVHAPTHTPERDVLSSFCHFSTNNGFLYTAVRQDRNQLSPLSHMQVYAKQRAHTHTPTHTHTHTHTQMYHVSGQNNIVLLVFCSHKSRFFLWINWPKIVALFQLIVVIDSQPFVMYAGVSKLVIVVKIKQKK